MKELLRLNEVIKDDRRYAYYGEGTSESPIRFLVGTNINEVGELISVAKQEDLDGGNKIFVEFNDFLFYVFSDPDEFRPIINVVFVGGSGKEEKIKFEKDEAKRAVNYAVSIHEGVFRGVLANRLGRILGK